MHWSAEYVSQEARGGDLALNCLGLCVRVYRERLGRKLVGLLSLARACRRGGAIPLREVASPRAFDLVVMGDENRPARHVGVWVDADRGRVLHADTDAGQVVLSRLEVLRVGYPSLRFVRPEAA